MDVTSVAIARVDISGMLRFLLKMPTQCQQAYAQGREVDISGLIEKNFDSILFCGIGGSAIGLDLVDSYIKSHIALPTYVNRDYLLPHFVNKNTLCFLCSYSGNTEEVLSNFSELKSLGCTMVVLTSGGMLAELARQTDSVLLVDIPGGFPPRMTLGSIFFNVLGILEKCHLIQEDQSSLKETWQILNFLKDDVLMPSLDAPTNIAKCIAQKLQGHIPVLYGAHAQTASIIQRWKSQLAENSKVLSWGNTFPEISHNEIVGWQLLPVPHEMLAVVFLNMKHAYARIRTHMEIARALIKETRVEIIEVDSYGESFLAQMFSLLYVGDFASYYLALYYGEDPTPIKNTEYIKCQLRTTYQQNKE